MINVNVKSFLLGGGVVLSVFTAILIPVFLNNRKKDRLIVEQHEKMQKMKAENEMLSHINYEQKIKSVYSMYENLPNSSGEDIKLRNVIRDKIIEILISKRDGKNVSSLDAGIYELHEKFMNSENIDESKEAFDKLKHAVLNPCPRVTGRVRLKTRRIPLSLSVGCEVVAFYDGLFKN